MPVPTLMGTMDVVTDVRTMLALLRLFRFLSYALGRCRGVYMQSRYGMDQTIASLRVGVLHRCWPTHTLDTMRDETWQYNEKSLRYHPELSTGNFLMDRKRSNMDLPDIL